MKIKAGGGEDVASKTTINSSGILPARAATTATDCCGGPQPPSSSASSSQMSIMKWISRRTGDNIDLGLFRLGELATDHVDLSSPRLFAKLSGRRLNTRTLSKKGIRKVILQAGGQDSGGSKWKTKTKTWTVLSGLWDSFPHCAAPRQKCSTGALDGTLVNRSVLLPSYADFAVQVFDMLRSTQDRVPPAAMVHDKIVQMVVNLLLGQRHCCKQ